MIAEDYKQKHIGAMMAESEEAIFVTTKENPAVWISKDQQFIKIMIQAQGVGQPQTVQMTNESMLSVTPDRNFMEEMSEQVQESLWSQYNTEAFLTFRIYKESTQTKDSQRNDEILGDYRS